MKKYQYITIQQVNDKLHEGKPFYMITSNRKGSELGLIFYYPPWKQYVFSQSQENILFNNGCLHDIIDYIENVIPKKK